MSNFTSQNDKNTKERLEEIKKDFIRIIPQLEDIQEVQKTYREIQDKQLGDQIPFINIQTSSTS